MGSIQEHTPQARQYTSHISISDPGPHLWSVIRQTPDQHVRSISNSILRPSQTKLFESGTTGQSTFYTIHLDLSVLNLLFSPLSFLGSLSTPIREWSYYQSVHQPTGTGASTPHMIEQPVHLPADNVTISRTPCNVLQSSPPLQPQEKFQSAPSQVVIDTGSTHHMHSEWDS